MTVVILRAANVYHPSPIEQIVEGKRRASSETAWKRMRSDIFKFADVCDKFLYKGYVFARPEGDKSDRVERIAPLYSEWSVPRSNSPHRNIMAVVYAGAPMGYLLAYEDGGEVFLDVICAKPGFGKPLMQAFVRTFSHKNIRLNALSYVLSYYQQYGFHFGSRCGRRNRHLDKLAKTVAPGSFDAYTLENAYRTRSKVRRLLNTLKSENLHVNKQPCGEKNKTCFAGDGFEMIRCRTRRKS